MCFFFFCLFVIQECCNLVLVDIFIVMRDDKVTDPITRGVLTHITTNLIFFFLLVVVRYENFNQVTNCENKIELNVEQVRVTVGGHCDQSAPFVL